jgi:ribosomal protein S27AE
MMTASDVKIAGISDQDEDYCLDCAVKRYGSLRVERLRAGLEYHDDYWSGPRVYYQWQADERKPDGEHCPRCGEMLCMECGKRLDRLADTLESA